MKKLFQALAVIALLPLFVCSSYADPVDDCTADCGKEHARCIKKANEFVNDIEIQEAKEACETALQACKDECMSKELNKEFKDQPPPAPEHKEDSGVKSPFLTF